MKKYPVIIVAPHSFGEIPKKFRDRIELSDFEIWQMHDPFTDETCMYSHAYAIHKGKNHRIMGDLNRGRTAKDLFRKEDFYGRKIWKAKQSLKGGEKEELLKKYWDPFRAGIKESFMKIKEEGFKRILFIDHHNTATDHPANNEQYLPPINLGNFGGYKGNFEKSKLSSSPKIIRAFQDFLSKELPEITIETNKVYKGSSLVRFVQNEIQPEMPECEIHGIHFEYNLNLIFNPLSKEVDKVAKSKLFKGINKAISATLKNYF